MDPSVAAVNEEVGEWAFGLTLNQVPKIVRLRHELVLADLLTVTAAGVALEEYQDLLRIWPLAQGRAPIPGTSYFSNTETAAWFFGATSVALELDEGSKFAQGHPGSHVIPAILSLATELNAPGESVQLAIIGGYEIAARAGSATRLNSGVHPHGNWGILGAAAGCALLLGLDGHGIACAMDHAAGSVLATTFASALDGNLVRNSWMGSTAINAVISARMAQAGIAVNSGTAGQSLGKILGVFDPAEFSRGLGMSWEVERNYFKRHSACAFTHPPIDATLQLRSEMHAKMLNQGGPEFADLISTVESIEVSSHYLTLGLNGLRPSTRLAAMFSIPYVVAAALIDGEVTPRQHEASRLVSERLRELAAKVSVHHDEDLSRQLPDKRGARVVISFQDGKKIFSEVAQPVGDSDFLPLGKSQLQEKGENLMSPETVMGFWTFAESLSNCSDINQLTYLFSNSHNK